MNVEAYEWLKRRIAKLEARGLISHGLTREERISMCLGLTDNPRVNREMVAEVLDARERKQ